MTKSTRGTKLPRILEKRQVMGDQIRQVCLCCYLSIAQISERSTCFESKVILLKKDTFFCIGIL